MRRRCWCTGGGDDAQDGQAARRAARCGGGAPEAGEDGAEEEDGEEADARSMGIRSPGGRGGRGGWRRQWRRRTRRRRWRQIGDEKVAKCWRGRVAAFIYRHTFSPGSCNEPWQKGGLLSRFVIPPGTKGWFRVGVSKRKISLFSPAWFYDPRQKGGLLSRVVKPPRTKGLCWAIQEKPYTLETSGLPDFIK
jgi:hypothetical protein